MNITKVEENVKSLLASLDEESFIYDLLSAYGKPRSSISRLQNGTYNLSKKEGEIIWKKVLFFKQSRTEDLSSNFESACNDETIKKQGIRFVIVTDYKQILSLDTKTLDKLDIEIKQLDRYFDFFLPWAGLEKSKTYSENPADVKAAERMAKLYDAIRKDNPESTQEADDRLNIFLSRLLFCFFAEDTEIFEKNLFINAIKSYTKDDGSDLSEVLEKILHIMNLEDRKEYPEYLQVFPYVNGGLFAGNYPVPILSRQTRNLIIECGELNWSEINPDIFGSMIQAVAHPEQRSSMGMHYTSVTNIMKVIEPLFLNELYEEFEQNKDNPKKLEKLLNRIYNLKIFDPACGSGNFLIIAYKELRKLEMEVFQHLQGISQQKNIPLSGIRLSQFYGIELDKFAHEMAILSLWLAEHQMNLAFAKVFGKSRPTLPLKESGNITCGNATRLDWEEVCPKTPNSEVYILGNPPYLGARMQSDIHREDMNAAFKNISETRLLDYVTCWFILGAKYIKNSNSQFAFVSTNSICQGEQVGMLWSHIFNLNLEISFAHQSFKWENNAKGGAGIICIIVGVRNISNKTKYLFNDLGIHIVSNISPYLTNNKNILIEKRRLPLSLLPNIDYGNMAYDGGNLILSPQERDQLLEIFPEASKFVKRLYGSQEFIKGIERYCLWIKDNDLDEANKISFIRERIENVRLLRLASPDVGGKKLAEKPHQFREMKMANNNAIIIPQSSSERREYVPIGFLTSDNIISNLAFAIYDPEPWVFGVVTSRIHLVWMRTFAGKLKTDYRYSSVLCYNTFPIPELTKKQKEEIEIHVFKILEERENNLGKTMAQLYDPAKMPSGLKEAHHQLDLAIEKCYRTKPFESDEERLEYLFKLGEFKDLAQRADIWYYEIPRKEF